MSHVTEQRYESYTKIKYPSTLWIKRRADDGDRRVDWLYTVFKNIVHVYILDLSRFEAAKFLCIFTNTLATTTRHGHIIDEETQLSAGPTYRAITTKHKFATKL